MSDGMVTVEGMIEQHGRDSRALAKYAAEVRFWRGRARYWQDEAEMLARRVQRQNDEIAELKAILQR